MDWDLVVFDCDGVLVDTEPVANRLVAEALTEAGLPTTAAEALEAFRGGKLTQIAAEAEARLGRALPEGWIARVYERQFAVFRRGLDPIPGVVAALDEIEAAGVPVCVGSNGPPAKIEVTLGAAGLSERFAGRVFSADHVAAPKPAPDLYLRCAARMGADPARCVVVEDSARGAAAGVAAGMMVFGYAAATGRETLRAAGCTAVFDDMARVPSLLRVAAGARRRTPLADDRDGRDAANRAIAGIAAARDPRVLLGAPWTTPSFRRHLEGRRAGDWPIAVLPEAVTRTICARSPIVRLSPWTAEKQARHHPDVRPGDYERVQRILDGGEVFHQYARTATGFVEEDGRLWRAAVKATRDGTECYLATLHRAAERNRERARRNFERIEQMEKLAPGGS